MKHQHDVQGLRDQGDETALYAHKIDACFDRVANKPQYPIANAYGRGTSRQEACVKYWQSSRSSRGLRYTLSLQQSRVRSSSVPASHRFHGVGRSNFSQMLGTREEHARTATVQLHKLEQENHGVFLVLGVNVSQLF